MDKTRLKNLMKKFEEHLIIDEGLAKITAEGYCRSCSISLRRMRKYCPKYGDVKKHILWMHEKEYSYSHITNTILALEHFSKFKKSPIKLGRPKKPKRIIKDFLSESEITRLIQVANDIRKKAIVSLLAYSGIRNQELCNLKVCDIDIGKNEVRVLGGKNIKDRVINISSECSNVLVEYLKAFPRNSQDHLFTTLRKGNQLKTSDVRKMIRILKKSLKFLNVFFRTFFVTPSLQIS